MKISEEIKIIWQYLKKYKKEVYLVAAVALIGSLISAVIPYLYGRLVDIAILKSSTIWPIIYILLSWLVLTVISDWTSRYVHLKGNVIGLEASNDLLSETSGHLLDLPMEFHKDKKMGEIISRVSRGSNFLESIIDQVVFSTLPGFFTVIVALIFMVLVEWRLCLLIIFVLGFYFLVTLIKISPIMKVQIKINKAYENAYEHIYDSTLNIETVKSNTKEELERMENKRNLKKTVVVFRSLMRLWMNLSAWQQTIFGLGFVTIFGTSIFFLREGLISPGELVMFIGYVALVYRPFGRLAENYRMTRRGLVVIKRASQLLGVKPEEYDKGVELREIRGKVEFQNVNFSYKGGEVVLKNINFEVNPGQAVALVGESGVGKTTLIDLISRYYVPDKGKILIDNKDIQKVNLKSLRDSIALVPQEVTLFNDTIKNNIRYARINASEKEIIQAAKAANAHPFIMGFPKKYDQLVGERGIKLSTGQKQRVAIARAILRDPKILILDEATSSLDSVSEKLVQEALKRLIKNRTTFIIAHRLSTITDADKILVLEKGTIVEEGSHKDLIEKRGVYQKLYSLQTFIG